MKWPAFALSAILSFWFVPAVARAQAESTGEIDRPLRAVSIQGNVRGAGGENGLEKVRVELIAAAGESLGIVFTDVNGNFEFHGLRKRNYFLNISAPGYESVVENADASTSSLGGLEIYLKKSGQEAHQAPAGSGPTVSAHELSMPEKARAAMQAGKEKLYAKKDAQGSLADFQRAVTEAPEYYEAYYQLGMAHGQVGDAAAAELSIRKAVEASGDHFAQADLTLGAMLIDRKQFIEAEKPLRRAVELEPSSWLAHYELGKSLLAQNRLSDALASAEHARTLKPDAALIYRLLITTHHRLHNQAALLEDLDAYIKLDPNSPAGLRAKQLREEVQGSLPPGPAAAATPPPPKP